MMFSFLVTFKILKFFFNSSSVKLYAYTFLSSDNNMLYISYQKHEHIHLASVMHFGNACINYRKKQLIEKTMYI